MPPPQRGHAQRHLPSCSLAHRFAPPPSATRPRTFQSRSYVRALYSLQCALALDQWLSYSSAPIRHHRNPRTPEVPCRAIGTTLHHTAPPAQTSSHTYILCSHYSHPSRSCRSSDMNLADRVIPITSRSYPRWSHLTQERALRVSSQDPHGLLDRSVIKHSSYLFQCFLRNLPISFRPILPPSPPTLPVVRRQKKHLQSWLPPGRS